MRNKKNNILPIFILLLILAIGIGYAYLTSSLSINGTTDISGNIWDIHFANIQVSDGSVPIDTGKQGATIDPNDNTLITYSILLSKPGDYYSFTADIVNAGTIDGMIESIESKVNNTSISNLPSYLEYSITYLDGDEIESNHLLPVNRTETIKVRIKYKDEISNNELVTTNTTLSFSLQLKHVQANNNAVDRLETYYLYRNNDSYSKIRDLNTTLGTTYTTEEDMLTNTTYPFFLRHSVRPNNKVIQTDIGFVLNNTTYYLNGERAIYDENEDEWKLSDTPYEENKTTLISIFGNENCQEISGYFICSNDDYAIIINGDGWINIANGNTRYQCNVAINGTSFCGFY